MTPQDLPEFANAEAWSNWLYEVWGASHDEVEAEFAAREFGRKIQTELSGVSAEQVIAFIHESLAALSVFAECVGQIDDGESDDEWAKFRLEIKNYRHAKKTIEILTARTGKE